MILATFGRRERGWRPWRHSGYAGLEMQARNQTRGSEVKGELLHAGRPRNGLFYPDGCIVE